ncbi:Atypical/PIKK protein kinase [Puccinia striiformis f. sp. tritici PST-78]|uniref:Atypical/PIKK protein kinase n=1 Tax=Puccinia striiformis f. sp. tritici PST-78 TaxID=1165861 RepID=A0A0L0VI74_9BASI|nr:Atypical/PIKK protein kinase [Puccinia striiformis f. sp. tritici PST-78]
MAELDEKSFHDLGSQTNLDHDTPSSSSDQHQIHLAKSAPTLSELEELLDPELESAISITKIINSHPTTCPGDRLGLEEGRGADVKDPQGETGWFNSIDPCSHSPFKQHITSTIDCPQPTSSFGYKSRARTGPMPDTLPHWTILERKKDTITGLPFLKIVTSTESLLEECPGTLFWTTLTPPFGRETRETPRTANFTAQTFELNITKCVKQAYPLYKKISSPKAAQSLFSLSCLGIGIPLVSRLGAEELMLIPLISRFPTPNRIYNIFKQHPKDVDSVLSITPSNKLVAIFPQLCSILFSQETCPQSIMRIVRGIITLDSLGTLVHLAHLQVVLPCQPNLAECTHGHKLQLELLHNLFCWYQDLYYQLSTNPTPFSTDDFVQRLGAQRFPILTNLDISMHMGTPGRLDYIEGIGPTVKRLGGKSGPILIELIGEAGRRYQQILKPEDLRQDALVMQLHRLASMALHNNESTRKWGLQVRTYSVTPMGLNFGIIQYLPDFRPLSLFFQEFLPPNQNLKNPRRLNSNSTRKVIRYQALKIWRKQTHTKKIKFIQTAAIHWVLSFLLGIGDRHPHNILVSLNTLEIVHIDFGICFGEGELLETPELVALEAICKRADGIMEILKIITFNCPKPIDEAFKHTQSTRTPEEFRDQLLQAIDACLIDKTTIEERTSKLV